MRLKNIGKFDQKNGQGLSKAWKFINTIDTT